MVKQTSVVHRLQVAVPRPHAFSVPFTNFANFAVHPKIKGTKWDEYRIE